MNGSVQHIGMPFQKGPKHSVFKKAFLIFFAGSYGAVMLNSGILPDTLGDLIAHFEIRSIGATVEERTLSASCRVTSIAIREQGNDCDRLMP